MSIFTNNEYGLPRRKRVAAVVGTRPEAIKLAPVILALKSDPANFETIVVATAQHRQMLDQVLSLFQIEPDVDLDLMRPNQSLADFTARALLELDRAYQQLEPDIVLVQGDTTTASTAALAAFYRRIPVGHVEAGLRSSDRCEPFPEEVNRRLAGVLADIHFAPTPAAKRNLMREGVPDEQIIVTGNTVIDAQTHSWGLPFDVTRTPLGDLPLTGRRIVFVTSHRRESWGQPLEHICEALLEIVMRTPDVAVVYPVHPNPNVRSTVYRMLAHHERIFLIEPLDYLATLHLMAMSHLILTDSGGIQEEAPTLNKPLLILRHNTERPEACRAGQEMLVGTARNTIVDAAIRLLHDPGAYHRMAAGENPFGDGRASARIVQTLRHWSHGSRPLLAAEDQFRWVASSGVERRVALASAGHDESRWEGKMEPETAGLSPSPTMDATHAAFSRVS